VLVVLLAVVVFACGGNQSGEEAKNGDTMEEKKPEKDAEAKAREARGFHTFDKDFQALAASFDGVIRGVDMYASVEEVKAAEETKREVEFEGSKTDMPMAELANETAEELTYNLQMAEMEDAVIKYLFVDGQLNSINILVHVENNEAFEAMEEEFIQYFTHKHGAPTEIEGRKEVWKVKGSDTHEIDIIDKQDADKFYLEVVIK
ncbi:MAG: hypothetical protein ACPGJS_21550, partial [Flammeovirgaceae bacterium]